METYCRVTLNAQNVKVPAAYQVKSGVVDIKVTGEGCLVKENKCFDCSSVPIIKDVCLEQKTA